MKIADVFQPSWGNSVGGLSCLLLVVLCVCVGGRGGHWYMSTSLCERAIILRT